MANPFLYAFLCCAIIAHSQIDHFLITPLRGMGPFVAGMSRTEVEKQLRPEEIGTDTENGQPVLTAYFMTPNKRVRMRFDKRGKLIAMILHGDRSVWHDARGIGVGTSLSTL